MKSLHDCHPFGGICAIRDAITDKLELLTSGNKNDPNIQVYGIKWKEKKISIYIIF